MKQDKQAKAYLFLYQLVILVTLLLAAGLRFGEIDTQSFWNDEGNTARLVERTIPLIIEGAAGDVHPPGYYLLLHGWRALAGDTEFALRSYSALCGVLTVALTAAIVQYLMRGHKRKSWTLTLPALWFITLNPLSVYYSQEARMYAQLGLAVGGVLWAAVMFHKTFSLPPGKTTHHQRVIKFILLAATVTLGLYTHYAFVFALFSLSCAYGLFWLINDFKNWQALVAWLGAFVAGGMLFLPWAPVALRASGWHPPDLGTANAWQSMARTLVVGVTLPEHEAVYVLPVLALFGILILIKLARAQFAVWASFAMAFLPMLMIAGFGVYRPAYLKFLIISICPLAVSLSSLIMLWLAGVKNRRWVTAVLICMLFVFTPAQITALQHLYNDPAYARDDYRGIVDFIAAEAQNGDAVLLNAPNQWEVFTYYYRGELPVYTAPYRSTVQDAVSWVENIVKNHNQLFVLYWGDTEADPERVIESALAQRAFKANEMWISSIRLARYGTGITAMTKPNLPPTPTDITGVKVGQVINLIAYDLPENPLLAGEILPVTLVWSAEETPPERYKVFIHLVDDAGTLVAQTDAEPAGGFQLTNLWTAGEEVRDNHGVVLPEGMMPGRYALLIGMYDFSGQRLPITRDGELVGDHVLLDTVIVESRQ